MPVFYITEQGARVRTEAQRLMVEKENELLADVPLMKIEQVQVRAYGVSITSEAMAKLAKHKIDLVFLTPTGRFLGRYVGPESKQAQLRLNQARLVDDPGRVLALAKQIIAGKLANQRSLLQHLQAGAPTPVAKAVAGIEAMAARVPSAPNLDVLRGLEGQGAVAYWSGFRALLPQGWSFETRAYYPPPDPVNALLSFGYTRLLTDIYGAVETVGLDPYLGVFHVIDYGRPSLALDLEEEWRPVIVDAMVLGVLKQGLIKPSDFEATQIEAEGQSKPAVLLKRDARKRFLKAYEQRANERAFYPGTQMEDSFRRMFLLQVQAFARAVSMPQAPIYQPYTG